MDKGVKIALAITGIIGAGFGVYFISQAIKKSKEGKDEEEIAEEQKEELNDLINNIDNQQATSDDLKGLKGCQAKLIKPIRNLKLEINNAFDEIKGKSVFPAQKSDDPIKGHRLGAGYSNLRSSPEVNTQSTGFWEPEFDPTKWDFKNNEVGVVKYPNRIGIIIAEEYDNLNPSQRWFKVKLTKKIGSKTEAWVRADTVTFIPTNQTSLACQISKLCNGLTHKTDDAISYLAELGYNKLSPKEKQQACLKASKKLAEGSSSFDGSRMIQRYAPERLGAEVFPHSNWMLPSKRTFIQRYSPIGGDAFEVGDMIDDLD